MRAHYHDDQWYKVAPPLRDRLRERQRLALVAYLVSGADPHYGLRWKDTNALYAEYLIDVEMGPCMITSRVKQALGSIQTFAKRCLLNLEPGVTADANVDPGCNEWRWRKNYRVWEANYRIFLYPENWLEPELRDDKTPVYEVLENTLQQGEVTEESAEDAFHGYLAALDGIARLEIMGLYDQAAADGQPRVLHVIGRTQGTPGVFYYRQQADHAAWTPWERVDLDITEPQVLPIIWNRRFWLFWPVIVEAATQTIPTENKPQAPECYFDIQIAWSERKRNAWQPKKVTKQTIRVVAIRPDDSLADHGRSKLVFRAAIAGAGLKLWYEYDNEGTTSAPPPTAGTNQPLPSTFATTKGFHFTGCDGQVELFSIDIGGIYQVPGTEVDGMLFREKGSSPLLLPKGATDGGDDSALTATPGTFSIAYAHQDGYLTGRRPFFFQDLEKTYFVVPSEELVRERHWQDPYTIDPGFIIGLVNKYYYEPVWVDPLRPVEQIGAEVTNPRGPIEETVLLSPQTPLERIANPVPMERFLLSAAAAAAPGAGAAPLFLGVAAPLDRLAGGPAGRTPSLLALTGGLGVGDVGLQLLNARADASTTQGMAAFGEQRTHTVVRRDRASKVVVAKGDRAVTNISDYIDDRRIVGLGGWGVVTKRVNRYRFYAYWHSYVCAFMKELNRAGVEGLLRRRDAAADRQALQGTLWAERHGAARRPGDRAVLSGRGRRLHL